MTYLLSVVQGAHPPEKMGARTTAELRTVAESLDALGRGDLPHLADLLAQRFKALELSVSEGNWALASQLEVTPQGGGLASMAERREAAKGELMKLKLQEGTRKHQAPR